MPIDSDKKRTYYVLIETNNAPEGKTMAAHTTKFLFKGTDYFVAMLDHGGVRIGLVSTYATDFPADHEMFEMVVACGKSGDEEAVEQLSDEIYAIHAQGGDCRSLLKA